MNDEGLFRSSTPDNQPFRTAYLIAGYFKGTLNPSEQTELDKWARENNDNRRLFQELTDPKNIESWINWKENLHTEQTLERLKSKIQFRTTTKTIWPRVSLQYAAAIGFVLIISSLLFFQFNNTNSKKSVSNLFKDIAPGASRALLTLSNGNIVPLDSNSNVIFPNQGNAKLTKSNNTALSYHVIDPSISSNEEEFNILTVPAGGTYQVILPDGSRVWLNASSSLKYPTQFLKNKRIVELSGEGYFEIAKDPMFPFEVIVGSNTVEVLGTHFNINSYSNEPEVKVSLAEGAVTVNEKIFLRPGQQAQIDKVGFIKTSQTNLETDLAWKNGIFLFKDASLDVLMRQISRWYNIKVNFDENIQDHFNAEIPRDVPVSKLLHLLEATGQAKFRIEKEAIIVTK